MKFAGNTITRLDFLKSVSAGAAAVAVVVCRVAASEASPPTDARHPPKIKVALYLDRDHGEQ